MIRERGDSFQVDLRHAGKRIRKSFPTEHEAKTFEAAALSAIARGESLDVDAAAPWTMQRLLDKVIEVHWKGSSNEVTATLNGEDVVDILGPERSPRSITSADLEAMVITFKNRGLSAATINRKIAALSKLFTYALRHDVISKRPPLDRQKETEGRLVWLTPEQEQKTFALVKEPDFLRLLVFLVDTGCRLSEALEMDPERDLDPVYVHFWNTKNGSSRTVPLTTRAREAAQKGFAMFSVASADKRWAALRKAAGLSEEYVLHSLRHTCATRLVETGTDLKTVQHWLGHKTLAMTMRYAHAVPTKLIAAATLLERVTNVTSLVRSPETKSEVVTGVTNVTKNEPEHSTAA